MIVAVPGALLAMYVIIRDCMSVIAKKRVEGSWRAISAGAAKDAWLADGLPFFGYLFGMIGLSLLIGQKLALPIFACLFLIRWGGYSKRVAIAYAAVIWALMVFFYGQVMSLLFHPSYLELAVQSAIPRGFPDWLIF